MDSYYVPTAHPRKCCVQNCTNKNSKRHRFPKNNREVFNIWVGLLKPPNYETLSVEEINKRYVVCEEHFDPKCIIHSRSGLKLNAVPTLNVPGKLKIESYCTSQGNWTHNFTRGPELLQNF